MKQKLLTDIELDVHELKLLMNTFSKEPTQTLSELLKRSILRMQERLEQSAVPVLSQVHLLPVLSLHSLPRPVLLSPDMNHEFLPLLSGL